MRAKFERALVRYELSQAAHDKAIAQDYTISKIQWIAEEQLQYNFVDVRNPTWYMVYNGRPDNGNAKPRVFIGHVYSWQVIQSPIYCNKLAINSGS